MRNVAAFARAIFRARPRIVSADVPVIFAATSGGYSRSRLRSSSKTGVTATSPPVVSTRYSPSSAGSTPSSARLRFAAARIRPDFRSKTWKTSSSPPSSRSLARRNRRVSVRTSNGRSVCSATNASVEEILLDDHVCHREPEGRVRADIHGDPEVGVDCRGVVVGSDRHDLHAPVPGLGDEVSVGDLRVDRVAGPDQDQIRMEQVVPRAGEDDLPAGHGGSRVVISDLLVDGEDGRVQHEARSVQPDGVATVLVGAAGVPGDSRRSVRRQDVDRPVGDVAERLFPAHPLPGAAAAFADPLERVAEPRGIVHARAVAGPLLAAAGVEVGHRLVGLGIVSRLLLAEDDTFLDVDVPAAAALVEAVDEMGPLGDSVPGPFLPVDVPPALVARGIGDGPRRRCSAFRRGRSKREAPERQCQRGRSARAAQKVSAGQTNPLSHVSDPPVRSPPLRGPLRPRVALSRPRTAAGSGGRSPRCARRRAERAGSPGRSCP